MLALPRSAVPARRRAPPSPATLPAGTEVTAPHGQIAGALRLLSLDLRRRVATYELLVANQTPGPLAVFCYAVTVAQPEARLRWSAVTVPPHSSVAVPVEIALPRRGKLRRVVAELHAEGTQLVVDAEPPRLGRARARAGGAFAGAATLALAGGAIFALGHPRVAAVAAPARVESGKAFQVAYAFAGATPQGDYSLQTSDGHEVARGALDPRGGILNLSVPAADSERRYDLRITAHNALGAATRETPLVAAPATQAESGGVHMPAVWLDRDVVEGGSPIVVHYLTDALAGDVKLLDQDGTERAAALLNRHGSTIVIAPLVEDTQDFRLVVVARRGKAATQVEAPVRVTPSAPALVSAPAAAPPAAEPATVPLQRPAQEALPPGIGAAAVAAGNPIALARTTYVSGEAISVTVLHSLPNLRVSLLDDSGQEMQSVDVAPGRDTIVLEAPQETSLGHFTIVATYGPGTSEESVILPIVVKAR